MKQITILLLLNICFTFQCNAQFKLLSDSLRGLMGGGITWTDFDSDGDLDILSFGIDTFAQVFTVFYSNDDLIFNEFDIDVFPDLFDGSVDWADFDNNGHMDLALIGWSSTDATIISEILTFDSTFTNSNIALPGVSRGSIDWGDYNNDGLIDLLIVGQDIQSNSITKLFENRDSVFVEVNVPEVTGVSFGDAAWADYNSDGLMDFIITGVTGQAPDTGPPVTQLYKNTGDSFELIFDSLFIGLRASAIDWGDADNDGDLDLLLTGLTPNNQAFTGLYINDSSSFHLIETSLPDVIEGFAKWGDFDNDGDLDVLIAGETVGIDDRILKVYANDSLQFEQVFEGPGVGQSSGGWADFNNDGFLDIVINGSKNNFGLLASIYLNEGVDNKTGGVKSANTPPSIPINLDVELAGTKAKLTWSPSEDDSTPVKSLSYSIYLMKDNQLIISSMSNSSGLRSLVEPGNAGIVAFFKTGNLTPGNYTWSVQAIDNSFLASSFASVSSFEIEEQSAGKAIYEELENNILVYPNPVMDFLYFKNDDMYFHYQLLNLSGVVVYEGFSMDERVPLKRLVSGTYILKINSNKGVITKKIIKY